MAARFGNDRPGRQRRTRALLAPIICEALTNTAKHAHASAVTVAVEVAGKSLRVMVGDDGAGFTHGTGLVGLKDRVEALGGQISLHSPPGAGR